MRVVNAMALAIVVLALCNCGGQGLRQDSLGTGGGAVEPAVEGMAVSAAAQLILSDLDTLQPEPGVDPVVLAQLKEAMRALVLGGTLKAPSLKSTSCQEVDGPWVVDVGGTPNLHWYYGLRGDYDLNGLVDITDLTPLALNFNAVITPGSPARTAFVDGDRNSEINAADILPIALNYRESTERYSIYRKETAATEPAWESVGEVMRSEMDTGADSNLDFFHGVGSDHESYEFKVVPRRIQTEPVMSEIGGRDYSAPTLSSLTGRVTDAAGDPLSGARISINGIGITDRKAISGEDGAYFIPDIDLGAGGVRFIIVSCNMARYAEGVENATLRMGRSTRLDFRMLQRQRVSGFSALKGGSAVHKSAMTLDLPANSLVKADGTPLTSEVGIDLTYIDPTDRQMLDSAPGDFRARQLDLQNVQLESFGMAEVFIDDGTGQGANLAEGKTATLAFPIPESMQADAPDSTGLYSFNVAQGIWIEESRAYKNDAGTAYEAEVTHFSYWNCDDPIDPTHIAVKVTDIHGIPLPGVTVTSAGVSYNGVTTSQTDSTGKCVFVVETSATEAIHASFTGHVWDEVEVQTPDDYVAAAAAPVVATFSLPFNLPVLAVLCVNESGVPVPYAKVQADWYGPSFSEQRICGENGWLNLQGIEGRDLALKAKDNGLYCPATALVYGELDELTLVIPDAEVPPIGRFSVLPDEGVAPLTVTFDATGSSAGDAITGYHWQVIHWSETVVDVTEQDPVLEGLLLELPGHYYITLEVLDENGTSDLQGGSVCVY